MTSPNQFLAYRRGTEEFRGWANPSDALRLLLKTAVASIIASALVSIPLALGWYALFILMQFCLGLFLGAGLARALRSSRVRQRSAALPVLCIGVVLSLLLLQTALYLHDFARLYGTAVQRGLVQFNSARSMQALFAYHNRYLATKTGHGGVLGSILLHLQNETYAGVLFVSALITVWVSWGFVKRQLAAPFCRQCGTWMRKPINAAVVHYKLGDFLVQAIESQDIAMALEVVRTAATVPLGNSCVIARLYRCATCSERRVDVLRNSYGRRGGQNEQLLQPVTVSEDFAAALRSDPVEEVTDDEDVESTEDGEDVASS